MLISNSLKENVLVFLTYATIVILAIASYWPCIEGDFVFDDEEAVVNNNDVKLESSWTNCLYNDFWGTRLSHPSSHKSYRPLTILSYRLNLWLDGELKPKSFHMVNSALHVLHCLLLVHVYYIVFDQIWAFLATLVFAVHPVHTEAICAIVGRADLLGSIFVILSFLFYVKCVTYENKHVKSLVFLVLSIISTTLAVFCKEQGITAIGLCCTYDIFFTRNFVHSLLKKLMSSSTVHGSCSQVSCTCKFLLRQCCLVITGLCLLYTRFQVMGSVLPSFKSVDNPSAFHESLWWRCVNYQYIYTINLWLLIHPLWLCFDWSMGCIPLITSFFDFRIVFIAVSWAVGMRLANIVFKNFGTLYNSILAFALGFIVIPFIPASNIFFTVGFVIAERILYLPSVGYCMLIVIGLQKIMSIPKFRFVKPMFLWLIIFYAWRSYQRSLDWISEDDLFKSGLDVCPLNAKVHYNIAKNAADQGDVILAVDHYRRAISLNNEYDQAMNNLANILKDQGHVQEARSLLEQAIELRPEFAAAWMNLGIVEASLKSFKRAESCYLTALKHRNRYPDCYYNLGNLYLEQKLYDKAYSAWKNATSMNPYHTAAWTNMIIMLDSIGDFEKAEEVGTRALQLLPQEPILHFNVANALGKLGKYPLSEKHFLVAIEYQPENPSYHANLGVLYHRWKKYPQAEQCYRNALKYDPLHRSASENLNLVLKQKSHQPNV